ncbi:hypothetical protein BKA08_000380 [Nocardioides marinisabuli]|uniref:DUF4230 domain-containing protein n=1 Tax=Nocardioides marinisabuli TaxID=419476 RepID=A0A7Y9EY82_9ACTN|nr:hypothetical protein [Nocardioides marinisabuli]NYD56142.1 hypothetical protein [Nocardioides marinisabuli]
MAVVGALVAVDRFTDFSLFGTSSESRSSQVINSVTREEQVVLVSLGIQGIDEEAVTSTVFGVEVPGSGRTTFLQYEFDAKLGIEGGDVEIEQTGEGQFLVTIPDFVFIGHDNETFRLVAEDNGLLSFATPEIDSAEMITRILNDDTKEQYVDSNLEILRDQAEAFYSRLVTAVDPTVVVEFEFTR